MLDTDLIIGKLIGKTFVSRLYFYDELESTNDFAKTNNIPDNSLIVTNYQLKGRGRFNRQWESEKGKNLTFTVFKKFNLNHEECVNLNYCVAYAVIDEIKKLVYQFKNSDEKLNLYIKWPNDIIFNNKKIAGILIETINESKEFIIGVGINVNQENFAYDFATSLFNELERPISLNKLLINILFSLDRNFLNLIQAKYMELYMLWKRNAGLIREKINFTTPSGETKEGIIVDFLPNGQIIINENGKDFTFNSGEIKLQI